jgi:hypothetical protein
MEIQLEVRLLGDSKSRARLVPKVRGSDSKRRLIPADLQDNQCTITVKFNPDRDIYLILELVVDSTLIGEAAVPVKDIVTPTKVIAQVAQKRINEYNLAVEITNINPTHGIPKILPIQDLANIFGKKHICVGEHIEAAIPVSALLSGSILPGILFISQYRIAFVCLKTIAAPEKKPEKISALQFDLDIPHGSIQQVLRQDEPEFLKDKAASILTIRMLKTFDSFFKMYEIIGTYTFAKLVIIFSKPDRPSAKLLARTYDYSVMY